MNGILFAILVLLLGVILIKLLTKAEHFDSYMKEEKQAFCEFIGGTVVSKGCQLPNPIPDATFLNFQLAGKTCDLDLLLEQKRCVTPGQTLVPYAYTAGHGNFGWYA
jgi:hypothetical protein